MSPTAMPRGFSDGVAISARAKVPSPLPRSTLIESPSALATARSAMPSRLKSPATTSNGPAPTATSPTRVSPSPRFSRMVTVSRPVLACATSGRPSRSKSAVAIPRAPETEGTSVRVKLIDCARASTASASRSGTPARSARCQRCLSETHPSAVSLPMTRPRDRSASRAPAKGRCRTRAPILRPGYVDVKLGREIRGDRTREPLAPYRLGRLSREPAARRTDGGEQADDEHDRGARGKEDEARAAHHAAVPPYEHGGDRESGHYPRS